ncbi:MAG: NUDIX domain-containing protein [Patescibacteria group bacterium]|mgnify:CR=1 FL=1
MNVREPLTEKENTQLAELLRRAQWPLHPQVFGALMKVSVSVPIELAVLDRKNRVLMIRRNDSEYAGWHMPGTVLRGDEGVPAAIRRLLDEEAKAEVTPPVYVDWTEIPKGTGPRQDPNRHQISLVYVCWLLKPYRSRQSQFFPLLSLPEKTLPHHRVLAEKVITHLSK